MSWKTSIVTAAACNTFGPLLFAGRLTEAARAAAELGHQGIELSLRAPDELDRGTLAAVLAAHCLQLVAIGTSRAFLEDGLSLADADAGTRRRAMRRVTDLIAYGAELGAPVSIGLIRGQDASAQARARLAETLCVCADHAASLNQEILVEPINRYETPLLSTAGDALEFVSGMQRRNVKLLLDSFHMNIEEVSIAAAVRHTGELLGHFHAADSNRQAPGMGHIDFLEIAAALRGVAYRGWLSAEVLPLPDDQGAARQAREVLSSLA